MFSVHDVSERNKKLRHGRKAREAAGKDEHEIKVFATAGTT